MCTPASEDPLGDLLPTDPKRTFDSISELKENIILSTFIANLPSNEIFTYRDITISVYMRF